MEKARFISFEGGEGVGKSTQIKFLAENLTQYGIANILTREPGGSPFAEKIRDLLLGGSIKKFGPIAETLLFYAARRDHLETLIRPELQRGTWVICDRFTDSSRAYQGAAGGVDEKILNSLDRIVLEGTAPNLTFILDMPVEKGLDRAKKRLLQSGNTESDRYESQNKEFHENLRHAFLKIANDDPDRCVIVNADNHQHLIADEIWKTICERFQLPLKI